MKHCELCARGQGVLCPDCAAEEHEAYGTWDDLMGVGWRYLWDPTLRMGLRYHEDGRVELFRHDSHVPHPLAVDPAPVSDDEFRTFIKEITTAFERFGKSEEIDLTGPPVTVTGTILASNPAFFEGQEDDE